MSILVDCVGSFGSFGECSKTCGSGLQISTFTITQNATNGGNECAFADGDTQSQACNTFGCPGNMLVLAYIYTSTCSKISNCILKTFSRIIQMSLVDCVGEWSGFGECSQSCGSGTQIRTFTITTQAANNGTECAFANGDTQSQGCNTFGCPGMPVM